MIYVDKREPRKIISILVRLGVKFEEKVLETGDFVKGCACVERKTADDFASSLMDGRLFEQAKKMRERYTRCAIVISGKRKRRSERLTMNCLLGAMASITARLNIPIITLANDRQLVNFVIKFLDKSNDGKAFDDRPQLRKSSGSYNPKVLIIASIPGIGFDKAKKLFNNFGSIRKLSEASIDDIACIEGFGKITAKKILENLN